MEVGVEDEVGVVGLGRVRQQRRKEARREGISLKAKEIMKITVATLITTKELK